VVLVDQPRSRYPYSDGGRIAVPADADWLDPLLALSFAAAVTRRIGLATGVLLRRSNTLRSEVDGKVLLSVRWPTRLPSV
jgi:hypothetical protein